MLPLGPPSRPNMPPPLFPGGASPELISEGLILHALLIHPYFISVIYRLEYVCPFPVSPIFKMADSRLPCLSLLTAYFMADSRLPLHRSYLFVLTIYPVGNSLLAVLGPSRPSAPPLKAEKPLVSLTSLKKLKTAGFQGYTPKPFVCFVQPAFRCACRVPQTLQHLPLKTMDLP